MDIPIDAEVECTDGPCGTSTHVVLRPANAEVTHVVVKEKRAPHVELLVPVDYVIETAPDFIRLHCSSDELTRMRPFTETEFLRVDLPRYTGDPYFMHPHMLPVSATETIKHEAIPEGELAVRRGARVEATDGMVGQVDEFLVKHSSDQITHLVLREGHLWGQKDVAIPISKIKRFREGIVYLAISKEEVAKLPDIPMQRRPLGLPTSVQVRCGAEPSGYLTYYVLEAGACKITHVAVRPKGQIHSQYLVPIRLVEEVEPGLVALECTAEELATLEPFVETEYIAERLPVPDVAAEPFPVYPEPSLAYMVEPAEVAVDRKLVPPGEIAVPPGARVYAIDGSIGKMDGLMFEPTTGRVTHLILRKGHLWGQRDVWIPGSDIDRIAGDSIRLTVDKHNISQLREVAVQRRPR